MVGAARSIRMPADSTGGINQECLLTMSSQESDIIMIMIMIMIVIVVIIRMLGYSEEPLKIVFK